MLRLGTRSWRPRSGRARPSIAPSARTPRPVLRRSPRGRAPSDLSSTVVRLYGRRGPDPRPRCRGRRCCGGPADAPRGAVGAHEHERVPARRAERRGRPAPPGPGRDDGPASGRARREGRPAARERLEDGFGELLLDNLLRDRLPPSAFAMQHTFASGERVDAIVRVDRLIPVDSKFPLDNYNRLVEAESDDERVLAERQFSRDVKSHIDAIAAKYIRPDE